MANSRPRQASRSRSVRKADDALPEDFPPNVVLLQQRILPSHTALLARWVEAGRRMGICDASMFVPHAPAADAVNYVLVWVRENIDPAYMIVPEGRQWTVVDAVRQQNLTRLRSFAEALNFIRPVLPLEAAA